ncbi:uncharacterized protein LOC103716027 [Phoenix dactylifera]|uniref:Uncharacterized protein LOC103716027 n=1 Tax=Phoenix dactylifera TaxID=42345 RepID=A0A8B7CM44_PHODC|nr:uncharacterized protein LOC103716027 [Phoenix dactylifera]
MDRSVEEEDVLEIGSTPSPAGAKRRRRCVQSKLPWAVPREEGANGIGAAAEEDEKEAEEKGKRKKKGKSKPRTPKKSPVKGKQVRGLSTGSKSSPDSVKRSPRQKKTVEQLEAVALKVGNSNRFNMLESMASNKDCQQLKDNLSDEAKPRKVAIPSDLKESYSVKRKVNGKSDAAMDLDGLSLHTDQLVCDLRLEGKIAAEENVWLSTGKRMHPFFTCSKPAKSASSAQAIAKVKSRHFVSCPPVHVFDKQDDVISLDWKNWVFSERTLLDKSGCSAMRNDFSVFEGSVEPFRLHTLCPKEVHLDQLLDREEKDSLTSAIASSILSTGQNQSEQLLSHLKLVHVNGNSSLSFRCGSCVSNLESKHEDLLLKERLASYFRRCSYWPECSLWINKYQPENASEVCGNSESIRSLSEWLKSWHERGRQSSQNCKSGEKCAIEESEDSLYENDSDRDDREDAAILKNVLLITGPVGSGKSAAIYACAKEQGFEVIEVNASELRNGAHVKQKFGEAMESHGFNRWSQLIGPREKHNSELLPNTVCMREADDFENCSIKMALRECEIEKAHIECSCNVVENRRALTQVANKTLILFEDVDTVFDEDRGFISTILQLAETAKRPMILTSNNKNPILPQLLDRVTLEFKHPSSEELLSLVHMICASEKAQISAQLMEHLIRSCLGDIRKTLMLLQFWCQGKRDHTDRKMQFTTYSPLPFDIDAAHLIMPRLIPFEFRCELSEKVGKEINKTISLVEEQFMEMTKQEELNSKENTNFFKTRKNTANTIKTRKKHKLKRKNSSLDCAEFSAQANDLNDLFDASDSPATNARRKVKHSRSTILSSQSEDELCANDLPPAEITSVAPNSCHLADMLTVPSLQALNDLDLCSDPIYQSRRDVNAQNSFETLEMVSASHICDTFKLLDVSFVPESSFISEAGAHKKDDLLSMAVSSNNASVCFTGFVQSTCALPEANAGTLDGPVAESITCSESNAGITREDVESIYGHEEQGDSQNVVETPSASGYQLMDECSRIDFNMRLTPGKCGKCSQEAVSVPETWRKLRNQREDLKSYLRSNKNEASSIIKCASGLTDFLSETDIIFSSCNPIVNDILEPSLTPCVEPDASSWYDQQLEMGSTYAQHGLCFHASRCLSLGSELGFENTVDLAQEMLASSTNVMALGKLLAQGNVTSQNLYDGRLHIKAPRYGLSIRRELESRLHNIILSIAPARLFKTFTGIAFHEYLSFMSQISKLECSRLSKSTNQSPQRRYPRTRSRQSGHYLSSGALSLSPDDVEFLNQSSCLNGVGST